MRSYGILACNDELITELVEDLMPQIISLANSSTTKRKADNSIDYLSLSINENLDFGVLEEIVQHYSLVNRTPNKAIVDIILYIAKKVVKSESKYSNHIRNWWVNDTIELLLKSNDLKAAYSLYNDQIIKSTWSINHFLSYFSKTCDKRGLEEFWGEFERKKVEPFESSYKLILEAYLSMGDLKGIKSILNQSVNPTDVKLDSKLTKLVIERLITAEPQDLNSILTIINSNFNIFRDRKYDLIYICLVNYTKLNQLDHFDILFNLFIKEFYIWLNGLVASRSEYVEKCNKEFYEEYGEDYYDDYDHEELLLNLSRNSLYYGYFEDLIKFNQDFHSQENTKRFFQTIIEPIVYAEYPNAQLRNSILNKWLGSLSKNLFLFKNGDMTILIECMDLIKANFKDFEFSEELFNQIVKDEVDSAISNKLE
jgi:hypothetical protein